MRISDWSSDVCSSDLRLAAIEDLSLITELADDGALIVIFIHPPGVADDAPASGVVTRLEPALRHSAVPLDAVRVAVMHRDATALDEGDATCHLLPEAPTRRLLASDGIAQALSTYRPASAAVSRHRPPPPP